MLNTLERRTDIDSMADLTESLRWFVDLLPETAREELAAEHARGNLLNETTLVDGKKTDAIDTVKPFGNITYVGGLGPIEAAIQAADALATSAAPRRTGFYLAQLTWFANGRETGSPPSARDVGARGNAELVDLAPYAAMAEIFVPRGVIWAAYTQLSRQFGSQLSIGFRYAHPDKFGGLRAPARQSPRIPYNVPVLSIGNPVSTVKPGVTGSRPGYNLRRKRATVRRYLKTKGLL